MMRDHDTDILRALISLYGAASDLRQDMLRRAELRIDSISGDEHRIVNAGNGAWIGFCAALDDPALRDLQETP